MAHISPGASATFALPNKSGLHSSFPSVNKRPSLTVTRRKVFFRVKPLYLSANKLRLDGFHAPWCFLRQNTFRRLGCVVSAGLGWCTGRVDLFDGSLVLDCSSGAGSQGSPPGVVSGQRMTKSGPPCEPQRKRQIKAVDASECSRGLRRFSA